MSICRCKRRYSRLLRRTAWTWQALRTVSLLMLFFIVSRDTLFSTASYLWRRIKIIERKNEKKPRGKKVSFLLNWFFFGSADKINIIVCGKWKKTYFCRFNPNLCRLVDCFGIQSPPVTRATWFAFLWSVQISSPEKSALLFVNRKNNVLSAFFCLELKDQKQRHSICYCWRAKASPTYACPYLQKCNSRMIVIVAWR